MLIISLMGYCAHLLMYNNRILLFLWFVFADTLSASSEPERVCTTANSWCKLYKSNPLINVYTVLNGKPGRDIMFCIKPWKPPLHTSDCHFDHADMFTSKVILNLFGTRAESD